MTGLLEKALQRVAALSKEEQNAIVAQIIESLDDDEETWAREFREKPKLLPSRACEAIEEHRRGETRPLDETTG